MPRRQPSASTAATGAEMLLLDRQICFALYSTSLAMTKVYQPLLGAVGLTYPQYLVMLILWETDRVTVSAIGERLFLDSGTLTPLLKRLQAAGLVTRERDTVDERRVLIGLTDAGRVLQRQAETIPPCILESTGCSVPELAELVGRLDHLRRRLMAPGDTDSTPPTNPASTEAAITKEAP
ncbi:MarR family transcriptional regulator [Xylophilus sp. GOD-11R]|uniref:MarR family winged helix-turn-helix transcriptional regulator n=1 Tax=Xylophilus sp. GOD-11R TaxID=3089814 RepID=UPI00298BF7E8|nr:MarR family transcriptional regulator [Xylophilus sp. GOD-11R]WPB57411.1 MarR family transcriptional regulator [Xylophilus sp. GOD-11R]